MADDLIAVAAGKKPLLPNEVWKELIAATPLAIQEINKFSEKVFKTRGGRMGSGMGVLLEALWAYHVDQGRPARAVGNETWEIAWLPDNEYNDFACVQCDKPWEPATKTGEYFRVEAKSMNSGAEESKAHFDQLQHNIGELELLLVIIWSWKPIDGNRVSPMITDHFIGPAREIANLRDLLHVARGGSFVDRADCADGCAADACRHHGEPLNSAGKRERLSGPAALRLSEKVSFAANFGGLMRMLKTSSKAARDVFFATRATNDVAHDFISFMHRNFPAEEENAYPLDAWRAAAALAHIDVGGLPRAELIARVRAVPQYMEILRVLK